MALMGKGAVRVMMPMLAFSRNNSRLSCHYNAGFTLLEIILVLSIIGLASVLIFPNVGNVESRTFSAQVREAVSLLNFAKRTAVVQGQPASIEIYAIPISEETSPGSPISVGYWDFSYGSIRFEESTEVEYEVEDKIEIVFYPEGGSSGGSIFLSFEDRESEIQVNSFSGEVTIEDGN